ncbi:MAG TPA: bifunctional diguanylate cyclase/phosphodiesterase [Acidimicrobiales bacterium]|jgi:diguanylate cyclase (GGDEF)-like protein
MNEVQDDKGGTVGTGLVVAGSINDAGAPRDEPTQVERSSRRTNLAVSALSSALALATVALLLSEPLHHAEPIKPLMPQPAMFLILCVMYAAASWFPVQLHYRGNTYLFVLEEVPMLLGLVFLSPTLLVLAGVCAEVFVRVGPRRQSVVKAYFNVASGAMGIALAALVYREVLGSAKPVSIWGWLAAGAGLCTSMITTTLMARIVMRILGQTNERRTVVQFTTEAMFMAANMCLSFVVLDLAWFSLWAIVPLTLVAVLIIGAYNGYARLALRFASVQRLYDFSRAIGTASLEPPSMSDDVLRQVCTVMRARRAELVLAETSGMARRISIDDGETSGFELVSLEESSIIANAVSTGNASRHNIEGPGTKTVADPISGSYRHAVVAPIMNGRTAIGAIAAFDRYEELDDFDDDDLRLFETLVAHASASLERSRLVEELRFEVDSKSHQATHDALTGLPNRVLFQTRATQALKESRGVAVVLLDIDRFKDVNDTLGHGMGDRMLCEVSERLVHAVSGRATVARLGGDEFALVIADVTEPGQAVAIVDDLHREMSRPIRMDGLALAVNASAGIALAPQHGDDVALLLQRADIAMYHAKERRSKVELYSVEQDQSMRRWLMIGGLLTHALETHSELSVAYQPIADVKSGSFVRVEALARWNHPVHGFIPPDEFIGMAEQMGVINQISDFVLSEACGQAAKWRRNGLDLGLAVNLSGREFADSGLVDRIVGHLKEHDLPADRLTLEVTETEVMADLSQVSAVLDEFAARGISLAIDDYGTGYSSLAYIHRLPVQELKIDRSFVTSLPSESSNAIIVNSSIAMAHSLGLKVVAEGAEDAATCSMLAEADCDFIQGYYLSKPITSEQLESRLLQGVPLPSAASRRSRPAVQRPELSVVAS